MATDTFVTVSLAGTLFFSIPSGAARDKVALYLVLTMAPFAVVAPLIGPAMDRIRGGRRLMVVVATGLRALVCVFMVSHVDDLLLCRAYNIRNSKFLRQFKAFRYSLNSHDTRPHCLAQ